MHYTIQTDGEGPVHYGVCSNYLMDRKPGDEVYLFIRRYLTFASFLHTILPFLTRILINLCICSAPNFHLPQDLSVPLILIGPGTGIAPFRGFWHHRRAQLNNSRNRQSAGPVWLFFGCRTNNMDLYREEKQQALKEGVLSKVFLALSREKNIPKVSNLQPLLTHLIKLCNCFNKMVTFRCTSKSWQKKKVPKYMTC